MTEKISTTDSGRKLFFGLFIFPLIIAFGMALLLCAVVLLTSEKETPETLITAIKTGARAKRAQKAYELSNELNSRKGSLRDGSLLREIIYIVEDEKDFDSLTRRYMTIALSHFHEPAAVTALVGASGDSDEDVRLYALWSLGALHAAEAAPHIARFLTDDKESLRTMAAYVLGVFGDRSFTASIKPLLDDASADVRWNAALALARLGDDSGFRILKEMVERDTYKNFSMNEDNIEQVMINATKGLALIPRAESAGILQSVARNERNLKVRQAAMDAIRVAEGRL